MINVLNEMEALSMREKIELMLQSRVDDTKTQDFIIEIFGKQAIENVKV